MNRRRRGARGRAAAAPFFAPALSRAGRMVYNGAIRLGFGPNHALRRSFMPFYLRAAPWVLGFFFGASLFSFLNVVAWRLPRGRSFVAGRSACPACGHTLGFFDLVPVLSWLFLRGRCRYCGARVSPRYLLMELLGGALALLCAALLGATPGAALVYLALSALTLALLLRRERRLLKEKGGK